MLIGTHARRGSLEVRRGRHNHGGIARRQSCYWHPNGLCGHYRDHLRYHRLSITGVHWRRQWRVPWTGIGRGLGLGLLQFLASLQPLVVALLFQSLGLVKFRAILLQLLLLDSVIVNLVCLDLVLVGFVVSFHPFEFSLLGVQCLIFRLKPLGQMGRPHLILLPQPGFKINPVLLVRCRIWRRGTRHSHDVSVSSTHKCGHGNRESLRYWRATKT
mmetsp:Transcript_34347/g.75099  ORF Transcript_34347/g.75099 Transcript_34347/m.75099 type:complete len:215 (+) Transcript_34347:184-828(+)